MQPELQQQLQTILHLLAASAPAQLAHYGDGVLVADELALDFDDAFRGLPAPGEPASLPPALHHLLTAIDTRLAAMGSKPAAWTDEALGAGPDWQELRQLAAAALALLPA